MSEVLDLDRATGRAPVDGAAAAGAEPPAGREPRWSPSLEVLQKEALFVAKGPRDQGGVALFFKASPFGGDDLTVCIAERGGPEVFFDVEADETMRVGEFLIGWGRTRAETRPPLALPAAMPRMISEASMSEATIPELLMMTLGGELGAFSYDNQILGLARMLEDEIDAYATFAGDVDGDHGAIELARLLHFAHRRARLLAELLERCQVKAPSREGKGSRHG